MLKVAHDLDLTNPLVALEKLFSDKIHQVNSLLQESVYSHVKELPLISSYIIQSGGKRIRPLLTLAAAGLCGYNEGNRDVHMATCIEILHTATLLHDDVVDESALRRGKPTAHKIWGNQISILTGDFMFVKLFDMLVQDGCSDILKLFVTTGKHIIEGEVLQINTRFKTDLSKQEYFSIIQTKTGILFKTALELGAKVSHASLEYTEALKDYASDLGIAFQLIDDMLDYIAEQPVLGKPVGNDFFEGQITLPLIILIEKIQQNKTIHQYIIKRLTNPNKSKEDLAYIQELLLKYNVINDVYNEALKFSERARKSLDIFPESVLKTVLIQLTYFVLNRGH